MFNLITFSALVWLTVGIIFLMNLYLVRLYLNLLILLKNLILKFFERSGTSDFIIPAPPIGQSLYVSVFYYLQAFYLCSTCSIKYYLI